MACFLKQIGTDNVYFLLYKKVWNGKICVDKMPLKSIRKFTFLRVTWELCDAFEKKKLGLFKAANNAIYSAVKTGICSETIALVFFVLKYPISSWWFSIEEDTEKALPKAIADCRATSNRGSSTIQLFFVLFTLQDYNKKQFVKQN